jgi:hypothetical protein
MVHYANSQMPVNAQPLASLRSLEVATAVLTCVKAVASLAMGFIAPCQPESGLAGVVKTKPEGKSRHAVKWAGLAAMHRPMLLLPARAGTLRCLADFSLKKSLLAWKNHGYGLYNKGDALSLSVCNYLYSANGMWRNGGGMALTSDIPPVSANRAWRNVYYCF